MRARDRGRAFGQIVALGAALAVICTAAPGTASAQPAAQQKQQQQQQPQKRVLKIYVVGDSYSSGEGIRAIGKGGRGAAASYFDPQDPRHQSKLSVAVQAAARLQAANPDVTVEVHVVASSGATTSDVFKPQRRDALDKSPGNKPQDSVDPSTWHDSNDLAVNTEQLGQIGPDADAVIMGFGGNDALFSPLVTALVFNEKEKIAKLQAEIDRLLDTGLTDEAYRQQAGSTEPGFAPTLIARLIQVMRAIKDRAPDAELFVQNYPVAVDPGKTSSIDMFDGTDLTEMEKLGTRLNQAIARATEICGCGTVVDVSKALAGRELNADKPAINDVFTGFWRPENEWPQNEPVHPKRQGASLMADHIAESWAKGFGLKVPPRQGDRQTTPGNITVRNTPAPDTDGDGVPDYKDRDWDDDRIRNSHDTRPETPDGPVRKRSEESFDPPTVRPRGSGPSQSQPPRSRGGKPLPQAAPKTAPQSPGDKPQSPPQQAVPPTQGGGPSAQPPQQPTPPRGDVRPPTQPAPAPAPPSPSPSPSPQPPQPPKSGSGKPKPKPAVKIPRPVIRPSTSMRSSSVPTIPKPPTAPTFKSPFAPQGEPPPPLLGLKPPSLPGLSKPSTGKYPLGSGGPRKPSGGASSPPLPTRSPGALPTRNPAGGGGTGSSAPTS